MSNGGHLLISCPKMSTIVLKLHQTLVGILRGGIVGPGVLTNRSADRARTTTNLSLSLSLALEAY